MHTHLVNYFQQPKTKNSKIKNKKHNLCTIIVYICQLRYNKSFPTSIAVNNSIPIYKIKNLPSLISFFNGCQTLLSAMSVRIYIVILFSWALLTAVTPTLVRLAASANLQSRLDGTYSSSQAPFFSN